MCNVLCLLYEENLALKSLLSDSYQLVAYLRDISVFRKYKLGNGRYYLMWIWTKWVKLYQRSDVEPVYDLIILIDQTNNKTEYFHDIWQVNL